MLRPPLCDLASSMLYHAHTRNTAPTHTIPRPLKQQYSHLQHAVLALLAAHPRPVLPPSAKVLGYCRMRRILVCFPSHSFLSLSFSFTPLSPILLLPTSLIHILFLLSADTGPLVSHLIRSRAGPHLNQQEHVGVAGAAFSLSSTPPEPPERRVRHTTHALDTTTTHTISHPRPPALTLLAAHVTNGALRSTRTSSPELVDCLSGGVFFVPADRSLKSIVARDSQGRCHPIWGGPVALALWALGAAAVQIIPQTSMSTRPPSSFCVDFPSISFSMPVLPCSQFLLRRQT
ncbi:hypothetical protein B0H13DRAFT_2313152 [Mycena leptocephala]|nr:hypothetical protein B0H13DRAFT_2313152 [Mycena leptocephala]